MISIKCPLPFTLKLAEMNPLQGALKHRTQNDIDALRSSLTANGLLQPFVIWNDKILDGHGRYTALAQMAQSDDTIANAQWPVVQVEAATLEEARQNILEMNARYGKITPRGLETFLRETPAVKVPSALGVKVSSGPLSAPVSTPKTHAIIKLRIAKDMVSKFTDILKELSYVEIV